MAYLIVWRNGSVHGRTKYMLRDTLADAIKVAKMRVNQGMGLVRIYRADLLVELRRQLDVPRIPWQYRIKGVDEGETHAPHHLLNGLEKVLGDGQADI